MTDIIPNDLSHMSDADFNALCPQGHHAPGPEPLSPAAQAVLRAAGDSEPGIYATIAAALRACNDWRIDTEFIDGVEYIRITTLEKIAAELEAYQ